MLDGLERREVKALRAIALDEQEFRNHIWPELPSSRPERNLSFSFVWGDLHRKSEASLARTLAAFGGRHYELVGVRSLHGTTQYQSYLVHRDTAVIVRDATGAEQLLRLFGSTLEKDGKFKVFSYVVD